MYHHFPLFSLASANTSLPLHSKLGFAQPTLKFSLVLKRYARQYIVTQFVPCFVNAMLCVLVFLLPADAGERLGVGINVILIMWVNYLRVGFGFVCWGKDHLTFEGGGKGGRYWKEISFSTLNNEKFSCTYGFISYSAFDWKNISHHMFVGVKKFLHWSNPPTLPPPLPPKKVKLSAPNAIFFILRCVVLLCCVASCQVLSCRVVSCRVALCCAVLCCVVLFGSMLCMWSCVISWHVMPCRVMSCFAGMCCDVNVVLLASGKEGKCRCPPSPKFWV